MKKIYYLLLPALFFLALLSSCTKGDFCPANDQPKNLRLKEMVWNGRNYTFYYNRHNDVDSVRAEDKANHYTYRVYYTGRRIDSVALIDGGVALSTHTHFTYKGDKITGYDYHWHTDLPEEIVPTVFTYDSKGRITTATRGGNLMAQFTYDAKNNVTTSSFGSTTITYSVYDDKLNPLYYVHNLFAIFIEEPAIWEYEFSQHNPAGAAAVNEYNAQSQLVKKTVYRSDGSERDSFIFSYYQ